MLLWQTFCDSNKQNTNTMKKILVLVAFVLSAITVSAQDGKWLDSFDEAIKESKKTGKPILANFTGSDWCGWCIRLDKEVFSKSEFKEWADKNVVLLNKKAA